jgi:hypothetical protein
VENAQSSGLRAGHGGPTAAGSQQKLSALTSSACSAPDSPDEKLLDELITYTLRENPWLLTDGKNARCKENLSVIAKAGLKN